jgi:hypothetical protein
MGKKQNIKSASAWVRAHLGESGIAWNEGGVHKIGVQTVRLAYPLESSEIVKFECTAGFTWQKAIEQYIEKVPLSRIPIRERPVVEPHENVIPPERRDLTIRRYMAFDTFERLVSSQAIWFGRLDNFSDKLEGSTTSATAQARIGQYAQTYFKKDFGSPQQYAQAISADRERSRRQYFISCWDTNPIENAVMWDAYAPQGIAIESTVELFETSLKKRFEQPIRLGMLRYLDFAKDIIDESNMMNVVYSKHPNYLDERELRAVLWIPPWKDGKLDFDFTREVRGQLVPVNLSRLITKVIVSSRGLDHMDEVQSLCAAAGLPSPIPSVLASEPIF